MMSLKGVVRPELQAEQLMSEREDEAEAFDDGEGTLGQ